MTVKLTLDAIERMVKACESSSETKRLQIYATTKVLTDELAEYAESHGLPHGYIREKIVDLLSACRGLAYLEDRGSRDSWYTVQAYGALQSLSSPLCFNVRSSSA
jgi:hypothetical protein